MARAQLLPGSPGRSWSWCWSFRDSGCRRSRPGGASRRRRSSAPVALRLAVRFPGAMPRRLVPRELGATRDYVVRSVWVSVSQIAQVLLNGTDVMIVGALLGPAAVVPVCLHRQADRRAGEPAAGDPAERRAGAERAADDRRSRPPVPGQRGARPGDARGQRPGGVRRARGQRRLRPLVGRARSVRRPAADAAAARRDDDPALQHDQRLRAVLLRTRAAAGADRAGRRHRDARRQRARWSARSASPARRSGRLPASCWSARRSTSRRCRAKPACAGCTSSTTLGPVGCGASRSSR